MSCGGFANLGGTLHAGERKCSAVHLDTDGRDQLPRKAVQSAGAASRAAPVAAVKLEHHRDRHPQPDLRRHATAGK